jgi:hypothetical protein
MSSRRGSSCIWGWVGIAPCSCESHCGHIPKDCIESSDRPRRKHLRCGFHSGRNQCSEHYLRLVERHKIPLTTSLLVVGVIIILAIIAFFAKAKLPKTKIDNATSIGTMPLAEV